MVSRRDVLFGGSALAATTFTPAALWADHSNGTKTNLAEVMVSHADYFIHGDDFTPQDLQVDVTLDSWSAEEIAGALAMSWAHLQESGNPAIAQIIDDYQNNEGKRFYQAFIAERGRTAQSVPTFINDMVNVKAERAVADVVNGAGLRRDYQAVHDSKLQAVILNVQDETASVEDFEAYKAKAQEEWQEGFELFKTNFLNPTLQGQQPKPFVPLTQEI